MNIFGEGFPEEIIKQVEQRQKIYGSGYAVGSSRTPEEILYLNGNTSWCKMMSAVNISNINALNNPTIQTLTNSNPGLKDNGLAKQFVLFNGTSTYDKGIMSPRSGISDLNNLLGIDSSGNSTAYGIGGTDFGIRPMMGIQSINVSHENRGSLRRAEVKIKAFNKIQFDIIDTLYLRLGYSILLEWGNSIYFNNDNELQKNPLNSLDFIFMNGSGNYEVILDKIAKQRLISNGNYDAMFAKVSNFSWSFLPDGSYDITINLISIGDIIESLKINVLLEDSPSVSVKESKKSEGAASELSTEDLIDLYAYKHSIGSFLYFLKYQTNTSDYGIVRSTQTLDSKQSGQFVQGPGYENSMYFSFGDINQSDIKEQNRDIQSTDLSNRLTLATVTLGVSEVTNATYQAFGNESLFTTSPLLPNINIAAFEKGHHDGLSVYWDNHGEEFYVRLGTFLQFLQNILMPQISITSNAGFVPTLKFDFDTETNLMYVDPLQISIDPRICVINRTLNLGEEHGIRRFVPGADPFLSSIFAGPEFGNVNYGKIMDIYINSGYILRKIDELKDEKNKTPLIDFLKGILSGVNESTGGISSLDVFIDETTNTVKIIDQNPLPNLDKIIETLNDKSRFPNLNLSGRKDLSTKTVKFDLYGYSTLDSDIYGGAGHSSFIKDFNFATEITPEFSTMITVGAAANGTVVGENDTALSKLNKGLEDRYKKFIANSVDIEKQKQETIEEIKRAKDSYDKLKEKYANVYKEYTSFLNKMSVTETTLQAAFDDLQELNTDEIDVYKDTLTSLIQYQQQIVKLSQKIIELENPELIESSPGTGFIPFNLSLTMDGLSGMKINQQFNIDTSYLPSNYPENVIFLIKNISHEVSNNKWYTKLESYCISKGSYTEIPNPNINPEGQPYAAINELITSVGVQNITPSSNKVGSISYSLSPLAKYLAKQGYQNARLPENNNSLLVIINDNIQKYQKTFKLYPSAAKAYSQWAKAAKSAGFTWTVSSAYRNISQQSSLGSGKTIAKPGSSPHGWGGALDFSELYRAVGGSGSPSINSRVRQTNPLYKWMAENGPKFGWYNPYRLADGNGVDEVWHWEYWGNV